MREREREFSVAVGSKFQLGYELLERFRREREKERESCTGIYTSPWRGETKNYYLYALAEDFPVRKLS